MVKPITSKVKQHNYKIVMKYLWSLIPSGVHVYIHPVLELGGVIMKISYKHIYIYIPFQVKKTPQYTTSNQSYECGRCEQQF